MSSNPNDLSMEKKFLLEHGAALESLPKYPEVELSFQRLRQKPGILSAGLFMMSGMRGAEKVESNFPRTTTLTDELQLVFEIIHPSTLATFMEDVFTFAGGLDAIKKKEGATLVGFTLRNETIMPAAFNRLSIGEQEELALLIGKMTLDNRIEQQRLSEASKAEEVLLDNGLVLGHVKKQETKPATQKEIRILELIQKANCVSAAPQPSPRPAPSTPSPSGASGSSAMHAAQVGPRQSVTPTHNPQPRNNPTPARAPAPAPMPSSGLQLFKAAKTLEKLSTGLQIGVKQQKEKIVAELKEYKAQIDNEVNLFGFFISASNEQKHITVDKILTHLNENDSIAGLALDLHDKKALEDDKLKVIAEQIHGYDTAIEKVTATPSPMSNFFGFS
jgi:hypothetical protein